RRDALHQRGVVLDRWRPLVVIADAEPAAEIEALQLYAFAGELAKQLDGAAIGKLEWHECGGRRADVQRDAPRGEPGKLRRPAEGARRVREIDAELVFLLAGGDLGVSARVDVGF